MKKAVDYALNQRDALCRYLDDGRLKPDNNPAYGWTENAIRPLAIGRKNERGEQATALFKRLIQSCKACGINPWEHFDDVIRCIMSHPGTDSVNYFLINGSPCQRMKTG